MQGPAALLGRRAGRALHEIECQKTCQPREAVPKDSPDRKVEPLQRLSGSCPPLVPRGTRKGPALPRCAVWVRVPRIKQRCFARSSLRTGPLRGSNQNCPDTKWLCGSADLPDSYSVLCTTERVTREKLIPHLAHRGGWQRCPFGVSTPKKRAPQRLQERAGEGEPPCWKNPAGKLAGEREKGAIRALMARATPQGPVHTCTVRGDAAGAEYVQA